MLQVGKPNPLRVVEAGFTIVTEHCLTGCKQARLQEPTMPRHDRAAFAEIVAVFFNPPLPRMLGPYRRARTFSGTSSSVLAELSLLASPYFHDGPHSFALRSFRGVVA